MTLRSPTASNRTRGALLIALMGLALVSGACSLGSSGTSAAVPLPAGPTPSKIAKAICADQAKQEIASALGETASISKPTWVDHLYSCRYVYPTGSMALSVKELSSWSQTKAYVKMLAHQMGGSRSLFGLGQAAVQTPSGSVIVRKDWKVLLVNPAGLPGQFGKPPTSAGDVAVTVADIILGCWEGD